MRYSVGVDVGGTKIHAGLVMGSKVVKSVKMPTGKGRKAITGNIEKAIASVLSGVKRSDIKGIGIGVPGLLDSDGSVVVKLPKVPGFSRVPLKRIVEKRFRLPVRLGNDADAFALAEFAYGAGRKFRSMVGLTLGTGIGAGIIIDGRLYRGKGSAGEVGHMIIEDSGVKCPCGNRGCWGEYVVKHALARYSREFLGRVLHPLEIEGMARKGNRKAVKVYERAGHYLGVGLVNLNNVLDPEVFVVGGSISNADYLILGPAREVLKKRSVNRPAKVVRAKLKDAGVVGAACLLGY